MRRSVRFVHLTTLVVLVGLLMGAAGVLVDSGADAPSGAAPPRVMAQAANERVAESCGSANPFMATALLGKPMPGVDPSTVPAIVAFQHTGLGPAAQIVLATRADVGDVYGLAYDHAHEQLYASAYHRPGGEFGPGGPGGIYRIDLATGAITVLVELGAGADHHVAAGGAADEAEEASFVGKTSLGDLDISADGTDLYVTNLHDQRVYRLATSDGHTRDRWQSAAEDESWRFDARAFGLGVNGEYVWHAAVNSRESEDPTGPLEARLYRRSPSDRDWQWVMRVGLSDYNRTFNDVPWQRWSADSTGADGDSPILSDIIFRSDGAPIMGLRDRVADMDPAAVWDPFTRAGASVGDILPTMLSPDRRNWMVRNDTPFYHDSGPENVEVLWGALAQVPGLEMIVSVGRSPDSAAEEVRNQLFAHWYSNDTGSILRSELLADVSDLPDGGSSTIEGLAPGDVEALCAAVPEDMQSIIATATAEAGIPATATAYQRATERATEHVATLTANAPIRSDRETWAASTAEVLGPTLTFEAPTNEAAMDNAEATAAVVVPPILTEYVSTAEAMQTRVAKQAPVGEETATAAAEVYATIKDTCGSHNPYLITTEFIPRLDGNLRQRSSLWMSEQPAVVAFNDTQPEDTSLHHVLAYEPSVGATFGVAHDLERDQVYVGAYTKRLAQYGPLGPGGIYRIDLRSGRIEPWAVIDAGDDPHDMRGTFADLAAASSVGHVGLGDIEMSEANDQLYAVNLHDKMIYRFSVPDGRLLDAFPNGAAGQWWSADAVPFGLAFRDGWLYHGVVDTLTTPFEAGQPASQWRAQRAFVYRSKPDGSDMKEVVQVDLDYGRQQAWEPWALQLPDNTTRREPMLVDIEFRTDGDLILGLRDRGGDARILTAGYGDMVLTMGVDRDVSGAVERYIALTIPEVYQDNLRHPESSWGTLAALPWLDETVSTVIDPIRIWSGGAAWFDNVGGGDTRREEVYSGRNQTFGKSAGLGDIESLCFEITVTPSPTPTETDTPTGTVTAVSTPTSTSTPIPGPIYLPAGEKGEKCIPDAFHSDVVLVLDRSTSMLRPVEDGGIPKNQAAIDAAKLFVSMLDFTPDVLNRHDQVAIVGFNDTAWTQADLGYSYEVAYGALDQLTTMTQEGTRLDLAFLEGQKPLDGPHRKPENRPVIVLLTDGLPNRVPTPVPVGPQEQTVVEAAQLAKTKGTRIYTVGLGKPTDINPRMLIMAASERWMYYYAPRPEDLSGIYSQIAQTFDDCEPVDIDRPTPCIPEEIFTDVVLVLDMSTSMYRETRTGRSKHGAAVEAAALFADQLQLEPDGWGRQDQVAVVGFNDKAWTEVPLTADITEVHLGLGQLLHRIQEGTRLDLALDEGLRAVSGKGHYPENQMVMVFLTDGLPNRVPTPVPSGPQEQTVLEAATRAKDAGVRIFTVGLGLPDDVLRQLLEAAATTPEDYYFAPDGEDLGDIYRQIAGRIVECP